MIEAFTRHLVSRYGIEEVASWYFEVWNEPNIDFWAGEPKESTYYQLYDETAKAIKRVSPRLRVGGPSTAQAAWVDRFIKHCADGSIPVDFVSTHVYGNDTAHDVLGTNETIGRDKMVIRAVQKVHDQVKASAKPSLPIIFSEYNAAYDNEVPVTDSAYMGPWLGYTISHCAGLVDIMSYWAFSDVFEEQGVVKRPFYGGFGLMAAGNIPKATFNIFKLLHALGNERLNVDSESALATRRLDGSLEIAVWNYAPPLSAGTPGTAKRANLSFANLDRTNLTLADLTAATLAVMDGLGIDRAHVSGHHTGANPGCITASRKFEVKGPNSGRFRIGCIIHCALRDCSRLAKPNAQQVSTGLTTSPTRKASDWPHTTIWFPMKVVSGPVLFSHQASRTW